MVHEIIATNIDYDADENDILNLFDEAVDVLAVKLIRDKEGRSRGTCFIKFKARNIDDALGMDGTVFMGRMVRVRRVNPD